MVTVGARAVVGLIGIYLVLIALVATFQARLIYPAPQDAHSPAPGFEAVALHTADGFSLNAHWRAPEADQPSAVFFHGNAGSLAGAARATQLLAVQGYGVLLVNYRGYGGNPGHPSERGLYHDGRAAMAFLENRAVPVDRTIIIGNSIGSGPATQMAREFQPAALILVSPFSSLEEVAAEALPIMPVAILLRDRFANIEKVSALTMPILIQHGAADNVVPHAQGERLAEAANGGEFQSYAGAGHELAFLTEAQVAQSEWLDGLGL